MGSCFLNTCCPFVWWYGIYSNEMHLMLVTKYFDINTAALKERNCQRVEIVVEQCWNISIWKNPECSQWGETNAPDVVINSPATSVQKSISSFLHYNVRTTLALRDFHKTRSLPLAEDLWMGSLWLLSKEEMCRSLQNYMETIEGQNNALDAPQHAASDGGWVVIQFPDMDVFKLWTAHCEDSCCHELLFWSGVKNCLRYIPVHRTAANISNQLCKVLPAFHTLRKWDSTSSLSGVGKKGIEIVIEKHRTLRKPGTSGVRA